jgi:chemotaxis protein methyltransferase CheR
VITTPPELTQAQFRKLAEIIHADSGIVINEAKKSLLVARINRRLRVLDLHDFGAYCQKLDGADGALERRHLLSAITTNVTAFFREPHHFDALSRDILKPLMADARAGRRLRFWSAACSSGEEPYSLAFTVLEALPEAARHDVLILASDVDPQMVRRAEEGLYAEDAVRVLGAERSQRFMVRRSDGYAVRDEVKAILRFVELNLHAQWPFSGKFDVIFCRNVTIYFDGEARRRLWQRFAGQMDEGATLFIGHSERVDGPAAELFELVGTTQYRRNSVPVQTIAS